MFAKKLICRSLSKAPLHYLMHKSGGGGIWLFDPITKRTPWCGYSRANNFLDPVIRLAIIFPGFCHYFLCKEINVVNSQHSSSADQFISCWNAEMPYQDFNFLEGQLFPIHFQSDLFFRHFSVVKNFNCGQKDFPLEIKHNFWLVSIFANGGKFNANSTSIKDRRKILNFNDCIMYIQFTGCLTVNWWFMNIIFEIQLCKLHGKYHFVSYSSKYNHFKNYSLSSAILVLKYKSTQQMSPSFYSIECNTKALFWILNRHTTL